jgi:hypothetical protein
MTMRFRVDTTSEGSYSESTPCPGAHLTKYTNEDGVEMLLWEVNIRDLSDLTELVRTVGYPIIIDRNLFRDDDKREPEFNIEIYDNYRE